MMFASDPSFGRESSKRSPTSDRCTRPAAVADSIVDHRINPCYKSAMDRHHPKHRQSSPDPHRSGDRHESHLDTVAQKPPHNGSSAPPTHPAVNADRDGLAPTPGAQPPLERRARLGKSEHVAAGLKAILQGTAFTFEQMSPVGGVKAWLKVNKKDGFDCQSCAWTSPDGKRHMFEVCENGSKAFASEGTKKRATAYFFREHSIAELLTQSDYWL